VRCTPVRGDLQRGPTPSAQWWTFTVAFLTAFLLLDVAQITSGTLLLKRRPGAIAWTITWASLKAAAVVAHIPVAWMVQHDQLTRMTGGPAAPGATFMSVTMFAGVLFGAAMGLWLPALLLVWLLRPGIRAQTRAWTGPERA